MTRAVAITLLLLALMPLAALAQTVAILPPAVDPGITQAEAKATVEQIAAHLRAQGFVTIDPAVVQRKIPRALQACTRSDCARDSIEPLAADLALLLSLFPEGDTAKVSVSLALVDKAGVSYAGAAGSEHGKASIVGALDDAIARQRRGPGPWLTIQGEPRGADILINGKPVGQLPRYTGRVDLGVSHLVVHEPGYKELNTMIDAGQSLDGSKVIDVKLDPAPLPSLAAPIAIRSNGAPDDPHTRAALDAGDAREDDPTRSRRRATAPDYVLGGVLALGGVMLATIDPIQAAAKSGDCADASCRRLYTFSTRSTIEVAGGAALVVLGAAVTFWWKPFSVRVSSGDRTSLTLQSHF
jgi:hypothetical protein